MYKLILRKILFLFSPETIHHLIVLALKIPFTSKVLKLIYDYQNPVLEREVCGLTFRNPVGLAAGFDKNAEMVPQLADLGFGFIEIGTTTPLGQPGNPKPRIFRLKSDDALINRMGFNNEGVDAAIQKLKRRPEDVLVAGNIGKNKLTPNETALKDYEICFDKLYDLVDFFVVNVSSPNTPNLRELQEKKPLMELLGHLKKRSKHRASEKPIFLKIAPDLNDQQLLEIAEIVQSVGVDGVVATNTTISRENLTTPPEKITQIGEGGLSGKPLRHRSTEIIRFLRRQLGEDIPIIGVGGIHSAEDALEKLEAGATLLEIYTGFIYEGPALIKRINKALVKKVKGERRKASR